MMDTMSKPDALGVLDEFPEVVAVTVTAVRADNG
jgi:hypothetical protein